MANQEHFDILIQGVEMWNQWREEHPDIKPDLSGKYFNLRRVSNLSGANLSGADLREVDYPGADLSRADLSDANLSRAKLTDADLSDANLSRANLHGTLLNDANLSRANLNRAGLSRAFLSYAKLIEAKLIEAKLTDEANLTGANLTGANLTKATLVGTNLTNAILTGCCIYGISAWNIQLKGAIQHNLVITQEDEPTITVDDLEVAQFIYLLINNAKVHGVLETITAKVVLILGRFTPERKAVLDKLREALRKQDYLPILFDFEKPSSRNLTETVRTLAHLARFIIADLTDPSSIPQELYAIVPTLAIPVQPVLLEGKKEYAMLIDLLGTYHWMLPIHFYKDQADLLATLKKDVIEPAEQKAQELEKR